MSLRRLALGVLCAVLAFPATAAPPRPAAKKAVHGREVIRALLKVKASVNAKSEDGITPLMFAARNGKNEHFGDLLAAGARS